jgi:hypothetical protein
VASQGWSDPLRLSVVGAVTPVRGTAAAWDAVVDGTIAVAVGGVAAGGFGVEVFKSFAAGDKAGRGWLVVALAVSTILIVIGLSLRHRARRSVRVGIVVTATDVRHNSVHAQRLDQQAEMFSEGAHTVTLKTTAELTGDLERDRFIVARLADETLVAAMMAERLTPDAARINLVPTMPLHVGFCYGARLGFMHAREIAVHSVRQANGGPIYFPATSLRALEISGSPLVVDRLEALDGGDPSRVALALDLQDRGDQFFDQVVAACREHRIGHLIRLRNPSTRLTENAMTFTGVVEQTYRVWREAPLTAAARTGYHAIFLSGPVAIAIALGARLAADHARWTAFTFDPATSRYEAFPLNPTC